VALRPHRGHTLPLPRARTWARLVGAEVARFAKPDDRSQASPG
jgi:hypothetical protein